jgi:lysophospholipase L1-like esterase
MNEHIFCVFGDSTAWGAWDLDKGGWVNRLWLYIGEKYVKEDNDHELYNLSISGGTTETILARFESEANIRKADVLIFQTGGNDCSCVHGSNTPVVTPEKFRENIEKVIVGAKKITEHVIFIGLKCCDESKTTPVPWIPIDYKNENLRAYNKIMQEICEKNKVLFVEVFDLLNNNDFEDGIHPNISGHQKLFERIKNFLIENKYIS